MDQFETFLRDTPPLLLNVAAAAILILLVLLVTLVVWLFRRRKFRPQPRVDDGRIDVATLPIFTPPATGPRLTVFGTPVRLAAVVLAPAGRSGDLPAPAARAALLNDLVPGLGAVFAAHQPKLFEWPGQLSAHGFVQAFFNLAALPGDRGKGTVWCSLAGRFESGQQQYLIGLICNTERPNSLSQIAVSHGGQWLEMLRVSE